AGLMAGTFEIERAAQMSAEERAKYTAVVEAQFVSPPAEEEPEGLIDVDEEEDEEAPEAAMEQPSDANSQPQPAPGTSAKRKRRRRGGRGRGGHSTASNGQQQQPNLPSPIPEQPAELAAGEPHSTTESAILHDQSALASAASAGGVTSTPGQPGAPRKRRRRRGRRGGANHSASTSMPPSQGAPESISRSEMDRFGVPDEVDTTPRGDTIVSARHSELAEQIAAPNASSTPVWSLAGDQSTALNSSTLAPKRERESAEHDADDTAPAAPVKKGWWQRTFRSDG
ncbi:MAG TPA: hypothetical protein VHE09_10360, partial [Rhizomicrobium sp.]|nr:hypothetical protein [Rhizomicrobium sp.]